MHSINYNTYVISEITNTVYSKIGHMGKSDVFNLIQSLIVFGQRVCAFYSERKCLNK